MDVLYHQYHQHHHDHILLTTSPQNELETKIHVILLTKFLNKLRSFLMEVFCLTGKLLAKTKFRDLEDNQKGKSIVRIHLIFLLYILGGILIPDKLSSYILERAHCRIKNLKQERISTKNKKIRIVINKELILFS